MERLQYSQPHLLPDVAYFIGFAGCNFSGCLIGKPGTRHSRALAGQYIVALALYEVTSLLEFYIFTGL